MKKFLFISFLLIVISVNFTFAQEFLVDTPGKWDYSFTKEKKGGYRSEANYSMTASETKIFRQKINNIVEFLHQSSVLSSPKGFTASVKSCVYSNVYKINYDLSKLNKALIQSEIVVRFCPIFKNKAGKIITESDEVSHCDFMLNNPYTTTYTYQNYEGDGYNKGINSAAKELNELFIKPGIIRDFGNGITAYNDGVVIIAQTKKPYWIPVTVGELFDLQIKLWEQISKKEGNTAVLDVIKQEKSKYTPEELKLPAYSANDKISKITDKKNDMAYMRFNPDYFDKSLPRTDIQLITIKTITDVYQGGCTGKSIDVVRHCEFIRKLDLKKLKGFLATK